MKRIVINKVPEAIFEFVRLADDGPHLLAPFVQRIVDDKLWTELGHPSFASFLYTAQPYGADLDRDTLLRWLARTPSARYAAMEALPNSDVEPFERKRKVDVPAAKRNGGDRRSDTASEQSDNVHLKGQGGNSADAAIARLKRDRPDLVERIETGELSPNAAAIEAGFRTRTITVPLDPTRAAATLRRQFKGEDFQRLLNELNAEAFA